MSQCSKGSRDRKYPSWTSDSIRVQIGVKECPPACPDGEASLGSRNLGQPSGKASFRSDSDEGHVTWAQHWAGASSGIDGDNGSVIRLKIGRGPLLGKAIEFLASQGGGGVGQRGSLLQAQTSAIQVDVLDTGSLETHRLDLLVGGSTRGALLTSPNPSLTAYPAFQEYCPRTTRTAAVLWHMRRCLLCPAWIPHYSGAIPLPL